MNVSIISIGDEILIGQIVNRNAAWIAEAVTRIGCRVVEHCTVADDALQLKSAISRLSLSADVLLLTGGLGPTHDDITKQVLTSYFDDELVNSTEWKEHLTQRMSLRGKELTPRNMEQALFPSSAKLLFNQIGTAPGLLFDTAVPIVAALPGVHDEMRGIMNSHVLPVLGDQISRLSEPITTYSTLLTTGTAESNLADVLGEPSGFLGSSTLAFLPSYQGVRLRVGVTGVSVAEREGERQRVEETILARAQRFIYGTGEQTLAEVVGGHLRARAETVSVAESCTGGLLGSAFTDIPGSSAWFLGGLITYTNESKSRDLLVPQILIEVEGAVSQAVALAMAQGVRNRFSTTYGIGVTGVAGPDGGTPEKPVGTVWISIVGPNNQQTVKYQFGSDRKSNRQRSVGAALGMLWKELRC